ncbi:major Vault Protein repeat-containing domain protein [Opisthorchis viverrini]|uniref:Major vault protein n=1 Tax=Opisthorchis viverrini TaxID=6198 RepID=A0A1S8WYM5_OPIVI|nr:major Vault Protein repeat-containing domain protein [Opisthorchis viverrini]
MAVDTAVRIAPYEYVHILNLNTHVTRLVLGPKTYNCLQDEKLVLGPEKMICLTKSQYCVIKNPTIRDSRNQPLLDVCGQVKINLGDEDYRFHQDPFPLYPGEILAKGVQPLPIVQLNTALRLQALVDFTEHDELRVAGEEWHFHGPATYYPRKEVQILGTDEAIKIEVNTALCLQALKDCKDQTGTPRTYGQQWLVSTPRVYLPGPYEKVVETRKAHILTETTALHVRALEAHVDEIGCNRRYGEEWLITRTQTASHICSVHEEVICQVKATILNAQQYCVILNPVDDKGVPQLGRRKVVRGEKTFFLQPGETLESGVRNAHILQSNDGMILRATEGFFDETAALSEGKHTKVYRQPGVRWLIRGPMEYVPPLEVTVVEFRSAIALDQNEGVYVRNTRTGQIRAVIGETYLLNEEEELWEKKLPNDVVRLLHTANEATPCEEAANDRAIQDDGHVPSQDLTKVVTLRVPHNAAVQVYDYRAKRARVEFGPTLVMLAPDEQFTQLNLSAGKPKEPNKIKSLFLLLGPDFSTDVIVVETADHARLSLKLSYNWHFNVPKPCSQSEAAKLFSVPDFVGDLCKAMASRVRGAVAAVPFDDFHKNSARIVRASVFGANQNEQAQQHFIFPQNNLHITSIDIQCVEPLDAKARESLEKSVQLAIEIRTKSLEATAKHEADRLEQETLGALQQQKILDEAAVEEARKNLVEMRVQLATLQSTGKAKAEAQSHAEASKITGEAAIESAKLKAKAKIIETDGELYRTEKMNETELKYLSAKNAVMMAFRTEETEIEVNRFTSMVDAVGADTIASIANAGANQAQKLLDCLGLESSLITNGRQPVNLLATAHGLIGQLDGHYSDSEDLRTKHLKES